MLAYAFDLKGMMKHLSPYISAHVRINEKLATRDAKIKLFGSLDYSLLNQAYVNKLSSPSLKRETKKLSGTHFY